MARRGGNERVTLWTRGMEQYGKPRTAEVLAEFTGCWMEYNASGEGAGAQSNVAAALSSIWIRAEVERQDADDYFVWDRGPDENYRTAGDVIRYDDRGGGLRACVVPVEEHK